MKSAHFLRKTLTTSQDLSADDLDYTTSIGRAFKLEEIIFHSSVAITETITVTVDSENGSSYDYVLYKRVMSSEQDNIFRPQGECNFRAGNEIRIQCTNANLTGTMRVEIKTSEM